MSRILIGTFLVCLASTSLARPRAGAHEMNGTYVVECTALNLELHAALGALVGEEARGRTVERDVPVPCEPLREGDGTWNDIVGAVVRPCRRLGIDGGRCREAGERVARSVQAAHRHLLDQLPERIQVRVHTWSWFGRRFGVYPATFVHERPAGPQRVTYLVDDRPGRRRGRFATLGFALRGARGGDGFGCAVVSGGTADGAIGLAPSPVDDTFWARFAVTTELLCGAVDRRALVLGDLGLTFEGELVGGRAP